MTRNGWHISTDGDALTLSRSVPARFDVSAETHLPALRRRALAHEIRKDVWRALGGVRGFSPAVRLEHVDGGLRVIAGGRLEGAAPLGQLEEQISAILSDTKLRQRWISHTCRDK